MGGERWFEFEPGEVERFKAAVAPYMEGESLNSPPLEGGSASLHGLPYTTNCWFTYDGSKLEVGYQIHSECSAWAAAICVGIRDHFKLKRTGSDAADWYKSLSEIAQVIPFKNEVKMFPDEPYWLENRELMLKHISKIFNGEPNNA